MKTRALIIAIENYQDPNNDLPTRTLSGTNSAGEKFRQWLVTEKKVADADMVICSDGGVAGTRFGTTKIDVVNAVADLFQASLQEEGTDELFVYFSGHGFTRDDMEWRRPVDVLVASDFNGFILGGQYCLQLQELQLQLWNSIGGKDHYWFIDACRTRIDSKRIGVSESGLKLPATSRAKATIYTLYSTNLNWVADAQSGFTDALVSGLTGSGRAKGWRNHGEMYVTFELLCEFMTRQLAHQQVDSNKQGAGNGYITRIDPILDQECRIRIDNASPDDSFTLTFMLHGFRHRRSFEGDTTTIQLPPNDYLVSVVHDDFELQRIEPKSPETIDLYQNSDLVFDKLKKGDGSAAREFAMIEVIGDPAFEVVIENLENGMVISTTGELTYRGDSGRYKFKVRKRGVTIRSMTKDVNLGENEIFNIHDATTEPGRALQSFRGNRSLLFAESLSSAFGHPDIWETDIWLLMLGADAVRSRGPNTWWQRDGTHNWVSPRVGLPSIAEMHTEQGKSSVLVLFALDRSDYPSVGFGRDPVWTRAQPLEKRTDAGESYGMIEGVYHHYSPQGSGENLVSFAVDKQAAPVTMVTWGIPDRMSLITVAETSTGELKINHYLLPVRNEAIVSAYAGDASLFSENAVEAIELMYFAQTQFARRREVEATLQDRSYWDSLLNSKWLDPVMSLIAAYELIRRGKALENRGLLSEVVANLRRYFQQIPDADAIAKMAGIEEIQPTGPPLLLDGIMSFSEQEEKAFLPLALDRLDYSGPWTMWRGAVASPPDVAVEGP